MPSMLKRLAVLLSIVLVWAPALAQSEIVERLGVPGPITFEGQSFELAWSSAPGGGYYKQEYVPAGQSVETYIEMFLVEAVTSPLRPIDAANGQVKLVQQRKGTDPVANFDIRQNEQSGEVVLDFLLSDLKANPIVVEWNVYRYVPRPGGEGVVLYALSRRGYGDDGAKALLGQLKSIRSSTVLALVNAKLPSVSIKD